MLSILSTLVPVFGIILFGIVVERMGFLPIETSGCLNQFVYWIGLPMMLFQQLSRMEAGQVSSALVWGMLLSFAVTYLIADLLFTGGFRKRSQEGAVLALLSSFANHCNGFIQLRGNVHIAIDCAVFRSTFHYRPTSSHIL